MGLTYTTEENKWVFQNKRSGHERTTSLELYWEIHCDPISDDYTPDDISAGDLLDLWAKKYVPDQKAEKMFGPGAVNIWWFVSGDGTFESAPFQATIFDLDDRHFLHDFTWPENPYSRESLNFNRLPVVDKLWRSDRFDKGGFFQEATGWKPAPLQPAVFVGSIFAAARLGTNFYRPRRRDEL